MSSNGNKRKFVVQEIVECPKCGGVGIVTESSYNAAGRYVKVGKDCKNCQGSGYIYKVVDIREALEDLGIAVTIRS